jgi:lysophospholipase L1-like esterase
MSINPTGQTLIRAWGGMTCWLSTIDTITMQIDRTMTFRSDSLYRFVDMANPANHSYFKTNGTAFNGTNTDLYFCQWETPLISAVPVNYHVYEYEWKQTNPGKPTVCTIGDSITWSGYATHFRQLLLDNGADVEFVGNHTDPFGHGHSGEGGNTTYDILNRMRSIPFADKYVIWAGTNDYASYPTDAYVSVNNIIQLIQYLRTVNPSAHFYLPLLLARNDAANNRNTAVNNIWKSLILPSDITLIDLQPSLPALPAWTAYLDGAVHPNLAGYYLIAPLIAGVIA